MPPRIKYTRERILDGALEMTRGRGVAELSARSLAEFIGCSTGPVFTHFKTMDELLEAVVDEATRRFVESVESASAKGDAGDDPLLSLAHGWLSFVMMEPRLYETLFVHPHRWHKKWGPLRRRLAAEMETSSIYSGLSADQCDALVGRASIVLHGIGLELWSGRLAPVAVDELIAALVQPVVAHARNTLDFNDFHKRRSSPEGYFAQQAGVVNE